MEHQLFIEGMHCAACEKYLTDVVQKTLPHARTSVSLAQRSAYIEGVTQDDDIARIVEALNSEVHERGYRFAQHPTAHRPQIKDFGIPVAVVFGILIVAALLQRSGILHIASFREVSYGGAFVIGIIASVSTCLAVVGGLVLSVSASQAERVGALRAVVAFHLGRFAGFFILGAALAQMGALVAIGPRGTMVLQVFSGVIMLLLGVHLLDVFPRTARFLPRVPASLGRGLERLRASLQGAGVFFLGVGTFFLPCGFTQSMQIYALSTGNPLQGGMLLFAFALGTFPVLALLSFGSWSFAHKPWKRTFFLTAGLLVIVFATINLWGAIRALSWYF